MFDSAPGDPKFKEGWVIGSSSGIIPKGLLWYPAAAVMILVLGMMWIGSRVFRLQTLIGESRGLLSGKNIIDVEAKMLYVYSEADQVVGSRDVERCREICTDSEAEEIGCENTEG